MPLDPQGLLTQEERQALEQEIDPQGLLRQDEKFRLWGSKGYTGDNEKHLVGPHGESVDIAEYIKQERSGITHRLGEYLTGHIEGTIPSGIKKTLVEDLPKAMYTPEYAETHPQEMMDIAGFGLVGGIPGGAVGKSGIGMTKVPKLNLMKGAKEVAEQTGEFLKSRPQIETALDTPRQVMKELSVPDMSPNKWKTYIAELVPMSPETVFKMDKGGAGQRIYEIIDRTEQAKNRFLVDEVSKFLHASGGIKIGSESSTRVGRVLDGKLPVSQLKPEEQKLYNFLKAKFDWLYNQQARRVADNPEGYEKVARAASKSYKPISKVTELGQKELGLYQQLDTMIRQLRGKKKLVDLSKDEITKIAKYKKAQRELLQKGWLDNLSPGDRQAYVMLKRKIKDYLPHIFDRDELVQQFKDEVNRLESTLRLTTDLKAQNKIKDRLRQLHDSVSTLEGGGIVKYQDLPQEFRFKFFEPRKGAPGYQIDAMKAYQSYLYGFAKKFFGDPALKQVGGLFKQVDPSLKPYARWFIEDWAGLGRKSVANNIAGAVASWQWMTKLGLNPKSALVNYSQRLNTIAEAGEVWSARGWAKGWTDEGKELFAKTGLAQEVPDVLMEGTVPAGMEQVRFVVGALYRSTELSNRKHAFLTGYERAIGHGASPEQAIQEGIDLVHKTQFRYGKVGMPKQFRGPVGRLAFQFWSYPVKQVEFMVKLYKENPMKLVKLLAYAEGGNWLLGEFLNVDMSNALGFGINYGEVLKTLDELSEADMRQAFRHIRLVNKGTGLLPTGLGPTFSSVLDFTDAVQRGRGVESALRAIIPIQGQKLLKAYEAIKEGKPGAYPVYSEKGELRQTLTGPELFSETFGPKVKRVSKEYEKSQAHRLAGQEYDKILDDIVEYMIKGETEKAVDLMTQHGIKPSDEALKNAFFRRNVDTETRREMVTGERGTYQRLNK